MHAFNMRDDNVLTDASYVKLSNVLWDASLQYNNFFSSLTCRTSQGEHMAPTT
jgi:hypothetical protein